MAFRLPPQVSRRRPSYSASQPPTLDLPQSFSQLPVNESTEWVLFSPSQPFTTARTHTTSTERTPRTAGASRLSDFGSLDTHTRSGLGHESEAEGSLDEPLDEDGTELDSLDDGLHAFRAPSPPQEPSSRWAQEPQGLLPAHDGLGSFLASSQPVQNQLWQHEQYNPNRRVDIGQRRHPSVQPHLDLMEDEEQLDADRERWQRIEKWRMDQSRALLHEIEKATRKRRNRGLNASNVEAVSLPDVLGAPVDDVPPILDDNPPSASTPPAGDGDEPFWQRITRKVIRDLIGIDDSLLSVIFGEALPDTDEQDQPEEPDQRQQIEEILNRELESIPDGQDQWQSKLLQRIARELGILVHQLCEHPGAFTTYLNLANEIPNQYAGIPLSSLPEEAKNLSTSAGPAVSLDDATSTGDSILSPQFVPTLRDPNREHAAQWGIEDEDISNRVSSSSTAAPLSESARLQQEKEYWERELDVMMVFHYLRNRFGRRPTNTDTHTARRGSPDASRRAAIIRQHHPLVARAHSRSQAQIRRQSQYSANPSGPTGVQSPVLRQHLRRPSSSCASQSAKISAISSRRTMTGSSRNYWDIGGSVDSGSAIAPAPAGIGAWGDV
ncbi:hypothetical protein ARAM_000900 [Aspergillus rambellii]|uniref:Uncharacterized protein n=1 Tax=Aspergillus rambellii TaxID=308745 RepID=A0A0F8U1H6_9EURO|nr:hypothetical protein ARAM_000900 [Aspergillus rambellii]